ncbi:MAG: FecCD family ABC transporter permease [Cumulibacter sp.]
MTDLVQVADIVAGERRRRNRRMALVVGTLALLVAIAFALSLMVGRTFYPPGEVLRVLLGEQVQGATFSVGRLRVPRAVLGLLAGFCFGMAGVAFQTMLRNPLASPDIIGISAGASAAAAFAIVVLAWGPSQVGIAAIVGGLVVALAVYFLAYKGSVLGSRLILIGIGVAAMLESAISYILSQASDWDLQEAMRWLTGSLNGASWDQIVPLAIAMVVLVPLLCMQSRDLYISQLGDDASQALGVRVGRLRLIVIVVAVTLLSFATAGSGPIAFVAFLSGPIAGRLVGPGKSLLIPAALVGALLVLAADLVGQNLLSVRYPVGVVTGVLGAPFLIYLIVRTYRAGGSL